MLLQLEGPASGFRGSGFRVCSVLADLEVSGLGDLGVSELVSSGFRGFGLGGFRV